MRSGTVRFSLFCAMGTVATVAAQLQVRSGTGAYAGATGTGSTSILLNHLPLLFGQPATVTGVLYLHVAVP